jgi:His/Glu/Gln/Arg/opine family amino acid ABC transporter permease subunit
MFGGFLESYGGFILDGALMTVFLSVVSMVLALILGGVVTAARMSDNLLISGLTKLYIEVIRGLPMLVILSLFFYGLPMLGLNIPKSTLFGVDLDRLIAYSQSMVFVPVALTAIPFKSGNFARIFSFKGRKAVKRTSTPDIRSINSSSLI